MLQISLVLHHCYCCCYFTAHASQKSKRAFVRCLRNTIGYQAFFKRRSNQSDWVCPSEETSPVSLHSSVTDSLCLSSWLFSHHSSYSSATWWLIMFSSVSISPFSLFSLSLFLMESNDSLLSDFSISIAGEPAPNVWHRLKRQRNLESSAHRGRLILISPSNWPLPWYSSWQKNICPIKTPQEMEESVTFEGVFVEANSGWGEALLSGSHTIIQPKTVRHARAKTTTEDVQEEQR